MALIHCRECNREISDKAATCPHCGVPMAPHASGKPRVDWPVSSQPVTTIEQTGKRWKAQQLFAGLLVCIGVIVAIVEANSGGGGIGALMFLGGFVWFVVARIAAWWHHG